MAEIKNLKKVAQRIRQAIKKKEDIILYGDADLDGMSSVVVLKEAIANLGGGVKSIYFPDREVEGYGLNEQALDHLKQYLPALIITLDCGISNFNEIKLARKMGFDVIIVDHHKTLKKMPPASLIVNPNQKGDKYPFKEMAASGVTFRLVEALLEDKLKPSLRNNLLELVALATISDMVPKQDDNLEFLGDGLISLKDTLRPGLKAFWQLLPEGKDDLHQFIQKVISACHSGSSKDHLNEGYLILTSRSEKQALELAESLLEKSKVRQARINQIVEDTQEKALRKNDSSLIFEGEEDWPTLMLGPAASKLCRTFKKPIFLYNNRGGVCQGGVRTPKGVDSVRAMMKCSKNLETFGGHPQASGFRVKAEHLEDFEKCLVKYFK